MLVFKLTESCAAAFSHQTQFLNQYLLHRATTTTTTVTTPSKTMAGATVVRLDGAEQLQQLAEDLRRDVPYSHSMLGPLKCHELGQVPCDFYVDQWPAVNACLGVVRPEFFSQLKAPPYTITHFFARTNDASIIERLFNNVNINWNLPLLVYPGPNKEQISLIRNYLQQHGQTAHDDYFFNQAYSTNIQDLKITPVPEGYEFVELTPDMVGEVANNWRYAFDPFVIDDIRTLMQRFVFRGIRCKKTGELVAQCGQLHTGCGGAGWVHPDHRGKKLFQACTSRVFYEILKQYGFAFGNVVNGNVASWSANKAIGLQSKAGHEIYWICMKPFQRQQSK